MSNKLSNMLYGEFAQVGTYAATGSATHLPRS
jgi:hypothetical protein